MIYDLGSTIYLSMKNRIVLVEPSSGLTLSTNPSDPMGLYETLLSNNSDLDVLVVPSMEYLYFFRYAPASVVSHLYFGVPASSVNLGGYDRLMKEAHLDLNSTRFDTFLATHSRFLVYDNKFESKSSGSAGYRERRLQAQISSWLIPQASCMNTKDDRRGRLSTKQ